MLSNEEVQQYLADNGYPRHLVESGAPGLLRRYREFVREVESGYEHGLEDYRHDLDVRALISLFGMESEVAAEDERLDYMLTARAVRVWESSEGLPFWDFGYPRNARGWLRRDLERAGLFQLAAGQGE